MAAPNGYTYETLSFLSLDIAGHSSMVRKSSTKDSYAVFDAVESEVRALIKRSKGVLLGWQGDGGLAVFRSLSPEDDRSRAQNALAAARAIKRYLAALNENRSLKLRMRMALHDGSAIWRKNSGSIHSEDINWVCHFQGVVPSEVIGVSARFARCLPEDQKALCVSAGQFEGAEVFFFDSNTVVREEAIRAFGDATLPEVMGSLCLRVGLVRLEWRDVKENALPPAIIYGTARREVLITGVSLYNTLNDAKTVEVLSRLTREGRRLKLLMLDPSEGPGTRYADIHIHGINEALGRVRSLISDGMLRKSSVEVHGLAFWPHFQGVMVDGEVEAKPESNVELGPSSSLVLRVQAAIPPDGAPTIHKAPVLQYSGRYCDPEGGAEIIRAYVRGFRCYWKSARPLL